MAVVGSYGVGLTVRCATAPGPGETVFGQSWTTAHGGKGSNQAIAARRLGASVDFLTAVGPDRYGRNARELWAAEGVRAVVRPAQQPTMSGLITVDDDGQNRIVVVAGALTELDESDVARFADLIAEADVLVTGLEIPPHVALAALRTARAHRVTTVLNPAPAQTLPPAMWPLIDIMVPNRGEAAVAADAADADGFGPQPDELAATLRTRGARAAVITLGAAGACWAHPHGRGSSTARAVPTVVDTTGAGDAFVAALAVATAEGAELPDAVSFAVTAGGYAVTRKEVLPGLATREELTAFAEAHPWGTTPRRPHDVALASEGLSA